MWDDDLWTIYPERDPNLTDNSTDDYASDPFGFTDF